MHRQLAFRFATLCYFATAGSALCAEVAFKALGEGLEVAEVRLPVASTDGDSTVTVVRVDVRKRPLELFAAGALGRPNADARAWAESEALAVVTNAAMFELADNRTPTGYTRVGTSTLNPKWKPSYKAALVFGPDDPKLPEAALLDFDCDDVKAQAARYRVVIQGLRMVDCQRHNTWAKSPKRWSAALVAVDGQGRVLFLHCRSPYTMQSLIAQLLALPLGITRAMYLEGGPEASLLVSEGGTHLERLGSYETGFNENDSNGRFWPIPNVLGVRR
jgi:hypothetical protein